MFFEFKGKKVYYEVHGEGPALMMLNGIMMSTASWTPFLEDLSKHNKIILVDFLDQGQSEKLIGETYNHEIHIETVKALYDHLGLEKFSLYGISYGGEIALQYAIKYQETLDKLILFNTTASTSYWLEEVGNGWNAANKNWLTYYYLTIPYIYSPMFFTQKRDWVEARKKSLKEVFSNKDFIDSMERLTNSSVGYDVEKEVSEIKVKTLIVGCQYDFVTPFYEQEKLNRLIENSELVYIPNCGHGSMYEQPSLFLSLLLGFVNISGDYKIKA